MTVTTTAAAPEVNMEAVPHINGVREAVHQQCQQGAVNGDMDVDSAPVVAPLLHDVDLEKMHVDLYRGRYLTPQDFLDDISKIVQNSELRAFEDMDRMYKAQAMLIATQVSIQEFDPAFKLECERMAVRERQRREERRKTKEKGKEKEMEREKEEAVTRRSTRIPGQTLEISIMDPVKLERRLKRQRGPSAGSSHEGEEDGQDEDDQERESKRSRMSTEENERGLLEEAGQATHVRVVHFAASTEVVEPSRPTHTFGDASAATVLEPMIVDTIPSSGFDSTLLNPLSPTENVFVTPRTSRTGSPVSTVAMNAASLSLVPALLVSNSLDSQLESDTSSIPPAPLVTTNSEPFLVPPDLQMPSPQQHVSLCRTKTPEIFPIVTQDPLPVIVERPATPLPQFHIDEMLLSELHQRLAKTTAPLNIEQLEQLRAMCLEIVWRHRMDWERDGVVRELMEQVKRFVEEVADPDDL